MSKSSSSRINYENTDFTSKLQKRKNLCSLYTEKWQCCKIANFLKMAVCINVSTQEPSSEQSVNRKRLSLKKIKEETVEDFSYRHLRELISTIGNIVADWLKVVYLTVIVRSEF